MKKDIYGVAVRDARFMQGIMRKEVEHGAETVQRERL